MTYIVAVMVMFTSEHNCVRWHWYNDKKERREVEGKALVIRYKSSLGLRRNDCLATLSTSKTDPDIIKGAL